LVIELFQSHDAPLSRAFQDAHLVHVFINALIAFDFGHALSCSWILCDEHAPLIGNPMAPNHDLLLAYAS
jgi:uncharacterized membrane protein